MRALVIVSGPPGAGKSTLAAPLAAALGFPLLSKDTIKEALFDALGPLDVDRLTSSRRLGGAAMEVLWRQAADCPEVVAEANFRTRSDLERSRVASLCHRPVEVHCRVPVEVAAERFAARARRADHHPVHVMASVPEEFFAQFTEPFGLGPVVEVDTSAPVDAADVAARVRRALAEARLS